MSLAAPWLTQRRKHSARRLTLEKTRRRKLYKQFIDEASQLYTDALVHDKSEVSATCRYVRVNWQNAYFIM